MNYILYNGKIRVENKTKIWFWEDSSLCPETSIKHTVQEFHLCIPLWEPVGPLPPLCVTGRGRAWRPWCGARRRSSPGGRPAPAADRQTAASSSTLPRPSSRPPCSNASSLAKSSIFFSAPAPRSEPWIGIMALAPAPAPAPTGTFLRPLNFFFICHRYY